MTKLLAAAATLSLLALGACASGPDVRVVSDQSVDFRGYQTYGFANPLGTDQGGYKTVVSQTLKAATGRELDARGLRYDAANPQLVVNFNAALTDKMKVTSTPTPTMSMGVGYGRGYYGYRGGMYSTWPLYQDQTTVSQYKEGTLNIDIADVAKKQLVWEGVVVGTVTQKTYDNLDVTISNAVAAAFAKYPVAKPGAK